MGEIFIKLNIQKLKQNSMKKISKEYYTYTIITEIKLII
jgi:hypothetical protein